MVVRDTRKLLTLSMLTSWNYSLQLRIEMADKHRWFRHIPRVRARARERDHWRDVLLPSTLQHEEKPCVKHGQYEQRHANVMDRRIHT
jgi:hypothetical protein